MSVVQFNLLPDVKMQYIKTQRTRKLIFSISVLASALSLAVFLIMLFTVAVVQKKQLSDADKNIASANSELKKIQGLDQILTVQNQLTTLVGLHQNKHALSRIYTYLPEITPVNVSLGQISLDFTNNAMQISGSANSQQTVNTFIDTLKFTTYTIGSSEEKNAFPSVVESSFSIGNGTANFALNVTFDPALLTNSAVDGQKNPITPTLKVPKLTTTRSAIDDPGNVLFNGQTGNSGGGP